MPSTKFDLPRFPFGGSNATIVRWLKRPGDPLMAGEPLVIVVNDRVELALPAPAAGMLAEQLLAEGADLQAGTPLATIAAAPTAAATAPAASAITQAAPDRPAAQPHLRSTPVARRMAAALGLELHSLRGCGASGRVTKADVLAALAPAAAVAPPALAPADQAAFQFVSETHALTAIEIDMAGVEQARARLGAAFSSRGFALTDLAIVSWAAIAALPRHPQLNGAWDEDRILIRRRVNLALLDADRRTLIYDAQDLNLRGLARAFGRPQAAGQGDSTFTVAMAGAQAWLSIPALVAGQGATLGIGAARPRPAVVAEASRERIAVRRLLVLTLAYDARMLDQCEADAFLRDIKAQLERFTGAKYAF